MRKQVAALLTTVALALTGCSLPGTSTAETDRPYDSNFETAKDFAEYWCGPCEEVDVYTVQAAGNGSDIEVHVLKDNEYGFEYTVNKYYAEYNGKKYNTPTYICHDFDYYYLQEFLNATDYSELADKYDLTIELEELRPSATEGVYDTYFSTINIYSDQQLTDAQLDAIFDFTYDALQEFDVRKHFTKNEYCNRVCISIYCAPTEEEAANGYVYGGDMAYYGYAAEN